MIPPVQSSPISAVTAPTTGAVALAKPPITPADAQTRAAIEANFGGVIPIPPPPAPSPRNKAMAVLQLGEKWAGDFSRIADLSGVDVGKALNFAHADVRRLVGDLSHNAPDATITRDTNRLLGDWNGPSGAHAFQALRHGMFLNAEGDVRAVNHDLSRAGVTSPQVHSALHELNNVLRYVDSALSGRPGPLPFPWPPGGGAVGSPVGGPIGGIGGGPLGGIGGGPLGGIGGGPLGGIGGGPLGGIGGGPLGGIGGGPLGGIGGGPLGGIGGGPLGGIGGGPLGGIGGGPLGGIGGGPLGGIGGGPLGGIGGGPLGGIGGGPLGGIGGPIVGPGDDLRQLQVMMDQAMQKAAQAMMLDARAHPEHMQAFQGALTMISGSLRQMQMGLQVTRAMQQGMLQDLAQLYSFPQPGPQPVPLPWPQPLPPPLSQFPTMGATPAGPQAA